MIEVKSKKKPIFSICTEVTNRAGTIIKTLNSIRLQSFKDYEYIIVDNASDDNSFILINEYLNKHYSFKEKVILKKNKIRDPDIKSWNNPVRIAKGKYIVVCEGDDWFSKDHLKIISSVINKYPGVGVIVSPHFNQSENTYSEYKGLVSSKVMLEDLLNFSFCPPPSETIFLRENNNKVFLYDQDNFVYAGEYSLLDQIYEANLKTIIIKSKTVHRGIKSKPLIKTYFHIQDAYHCLLNRWADKYDNTQRLVVRKKLLKNFTNILAQELVWISCDKITFQKFIKECWATKRFPMLKLLTNIYILSVIRSKIFLKNWIKTW
jgi:glycosyltransferase involved in cell wall biosynthesis